MKRDEVDITEELFDGVWCECEMCHAARADGEAYDSDTDLDVDDGGDDPDIIDDYTSEVGLTPYFTPTVRAQEGNIGNSADLPSHEEDSIMAISQGYRFETGNSIVAQLPVGSVLKVVGSHLVEVVEVPKVLLKPGDRFTSKYGPATVVGITTRDNFNEVAAEHAAGRIFYIADGTNVVRFRAQQ